MKQVGFRRFRQGKHLKNSQKFPQKTLQVKVVEKYDFSNVVFVVNVCNEKMSRMGFAIFTLLIDSASKRDILWNVGKLESFHGMNKMQPPAL